MLPWPKKETMESKEFNSKDKKKMWHPNQEERTKEERQILKEKQQVIKKKTQGPRTKKEKLEQKIREEGIKRKKKRKIRYTAHCLNFMSFLSCF